MKRAATLMIQGTASSVGKSLLVAAFCRIYARRGLRVAPFKAQNMALNAHVTPDGFEIGRAQALQARACGLAPEVRMNPILLKPEADSRAQIVLLGKSVGSADAWRYYEDRDSLRKVVTDSLEDLRSQYDLVVIEGAGSPAEINLRERDLVNMFVAHEADAPVLLVGDIDRGGVFAHLFGTLGLLDEADRARIKGFLINKFRGDLRLLEPGLRQIEGHCARPVLGVVPHLPALRLGDEDSLSLDERGPGKRAGANELEIAVIRLPRIANSDDFDALAWETGVALRFVRHPRDLSTADLVILPGTKSTLADLAWLRAEGFEEALLKRARGGGAILGICGGCQMLGRRIVDPDGVEAEAGSEASGLGLLPLETVFASEKRTHPIRVRGQGENSLFGRFDEVTAYWLHAGRCQAPEGNGAFETLAPSDAQWQSEGACAESSAGECVVGTMVHGLLEHETPRRNLLDALAHRGGVKLPEQRPAVPSIESELDRLADVVERSIDMEAIDALLARKE